MNNGNLLTVTDPLQALAFDYPKDPADNARSLPTRGEYNPFTPPVEDVGNGYNDAGILISRKDQSADTTNFDYDADARGAIGSWQRLPRAARCSTNSPLREWIAREKSAYDSLVWPPSAVSGARVYWRGSGPCVVFGVISWL